MRVTPENYHTPEVKREYMSHSQWKSWLECPARTKAEIAGTWKREPTEAMLVGSYVDRALTYPEGFDAFVEANRGEIFDSKGKKYAAFQNADVMIARLQADPTWQDMVKVSKMQPIMAGEIAGVKWLYMADIMSTAKGNELLLDIKTAADFEESWGKDPAGGRFLKLHWIDAAGYWRQLAVGRELFIQTYGATPQCGIIGVKKPSKLGRPSGVGLWVLDSLIRFDMEIARITELTPKVMAWKMTDKPVPKCGVCDYCFGVSTLEDEKEAVSGRVWTE
jgi:hypothetical protein